MSSENRTSPETDRITVPLAEWLEALGPNPLGWTVVGERTLRALVPGPGALYRNAERRPVARSVTLELTPAGIVYTTEPVWT